MNVNFLINLKEKQKVIFNLVNNSEKRNIIALISRQYGKTLTAMICAITMLLKKSKNGVIYISPNFTLGRKFFRELTDLLRPTGLIESADKSTLTLILTNGSTLQCFSAESPNSLRGQTCKSLLIIDEAAFIADETSDGQNFYGNIVQPLTKSYHPKVLLISTPCGKQGFFYEMYLKSLNPSFNSYASVKCDIYNDEFVQPSEIEEIKSSINELAFRQEYMCEFLDNALSVFEEYDSLFKDDVQVLDNQRVWIGIDFSSVGEDETILTAINENNDVKQYKVEGTLDNKYRMLADIISRYPNLVAAYAETNSIGEVMVNEVKKLLKINKGKIKDWVTTNSSKNDIIGLLSTKISNKQINFNQNDKELYFQFGVFTYKISKTKTITFAAKSPYHDDRVLSLAMAVKAKEDYRQNGTDGITFINTRLRNLK